MKIPKMPSVNLDLDSDGKSPRAKGAKNVAKKLAQKVDFAPWEQVAYAENQTPSHLKAVNDLPRVSEFEEPEVFYSYSTFSVKDGKYFKENP